jgi:hypothetical protein
MLLAKLIALQAGWGGAALHAACAFARAMRAHWSTLSIGTGQKSDT